MIDDNGDHLNPASAAYHPEYPDGAELIANERARQMATGFTVVSDDKQIDGQLIDCAEQIVAAVLMDRGQLRAHDPGLWPTRRARHVEEKYKGDYIRRLTIAGALIAAEIDRLQRLQVGTGNSPS